MNYKYFDFKNKEEIINGVVIRKLVLHEDETGSLVETLRKDWVDVYDTENLSFSMQYMSITPSGTARDENQWHNHKQQKDRFICISGRIVTALYDSREESSTFKKLNLFLMGPKNPDEMYLITIPEDVRHGFMVISKAPGYLLNFPTQIYNPEDEGRIINNELSWEKVRQDFRIND